MNFESENEKRYQKIIKILKFNLWRRSITRISVEVEITSHQITSEETFTTATVKWFGFLKMRKVCFLFFAVFFLRELPNFFLF